MKPIFALSLLLTQSAIAAVPAGLSAWKYGSCLSEREMSTGRCAPFAAELVVLRIGDEVCGTMSQGGRYKGSSGWFRGKLKRPRAHVRFVDTSQSDENEVGQAVLLSGKRLVSWKVLHAPRGGLLEDTPWLARDRKAERSLGRPPASCAAMEKSDSPVSIPLAP